MLTWNDVNLKEKKSLKILNNGMKSCKWESVTKKRRQINWQTRKILQVELPEGLASWTRQRILTISHSCPRSVSKGVKEAPYWAVGGGGCISRWGAILYVGEALDSSNSRGNLRNCIDRMSYEAMCQIIRTGCKISQPEVKFWLCHLSLEGQICCPMNLSVLWLSVL